MKTRKLRSAIIALTAAMFFSGSAIYANGLQNSMYETNTEATTVINEAPALETVRYVILTNAEPKNGWCNFRANLAKNIQYPDYLKQLGIEGTINVHFVVTGEGTIERIKTVADKSIKASEGHVNILKSEAKKAVIASLGDWIPARLDGEPVTSSPIVIPVTFKVDYLTVR